MDPNNLSYTRAVVNAGAYTPDHPAPSIHVAVPAEVLAEIRRARIELYCGQDAQAVADIRAAREQLRRCAPPLHAIALQALDAASWLARHGHTVEAENALEAALARLQSPGATA